MDNSRAISLLEILASRLHDIAAYVNPSQTSSSVKYLLKISGIGHFRNTEIPIGQIKIDADDARKFIEEAKNFKFLQFGVISQGLISQIGMLEKFRALFAGFKGLKFEVIIKNGKSKQSLPPTLAWSVPKETIQAFIDWLKVGKK